MIDGGESYIGDVIDVFQTVEYVFSDAFRGNPFFVRRPFVFELVDHLLDLIMVHIPLIESHENASLHFAAIVEVFSSIGFRHEEVYELQTFKGREAGPAFLALTSATDGLTVFGHTGVYYFSIEVFAFRTTHRWMKSEELEIID